MKIDIRSFNLALILKIVLILSLVSAMPLHVSEAWAQVGEEADAELPAAEPVFEMAPPEAEGSTPEEEAEVSKEEGLPVADAAPEYREAAPVEDKAETKIETPESTLKIVDVKIRTIGKNTRAEIITSGEPVTYDAYALKAPPRVLIIFEDVGDMPAKKEIRAVSSHISGARLGRSGSRVRVVFDLKAEDIPYDIVKEKERVVVSFGGTPEAVAEVKKDTEAPKKEIRSEADGDTLTVLDVKIGKSGKFTRADVITSGDPVTYNAFSLKAPNRLVVDIGNAREIPAKKEIKAVSPHIKGARLGRYDGQVRVVFDYKGEIVPYEVTKEKDRIVVLFGKESEVTIAEVEKEKVETEVEEKAEAEGAVSPVKEKAEVPKEEIKTEAVVEEKKKEAKAEETIEPIAETKPEAWVKEPAAKPFAEEPVVPVKGEGGKSFTGQKVTLEFKDADLKNIFRIIAEVSGYNMIIDNAVTGKVTIRLINVPWDQALDLILETNDLGMTRIGNVIRVLPKAVIKKEEEDKLAAKQTKEKLEDLVSKLIPVSYAKASDIKGRLDSMKTADGKVEVDERTNTIIMLDIQRKIDEAINLVKALDTPTTQIMIEARIVEANTDFTRNLGVQWGAGYSADASHGNPTGYYFPNSYNVTAGGGGAFALTPPTGGSGSVGPSGGVVGINFGSINNTLSLDLRLSALETQGWGKVVSSPKVLTLDNKEAIIKQGVQIPYQTTSSEGTQTSFKDATLSLTVTPHATADGRLNLKITVNKDSPDRSTDPPSINTNSATTEILLMDGDTTVIGGIYTTTKTEGETYIPFLGRIPVIGWLFRSKSTTDKKTELLIFITPRIVRDKPA